MVVLSFNVLLIYIEICLPSCLKFKLVTQIFNIFVCILLVTLEMCLLCSLLFILVTGIFNTVVDKLFVSFKFDCCVAWYLHWVQEYLHLHDSWWNLILPWLVASYPHCLQAQSWDFYGILSSSMLGNFLKK